MIVVTLTSGTIFVMWLGEQITERGVGNGISLLIFVGIVIGLPSGIMTVSERIRAGDPMQTLGVIFLVIILLALIALVVYVESARRHIAISYASRRVGNRYLLQRYADMPELPSGPCSHYLFDQGLEEDSGANPESAELVPGHDDGGKILGQ